MELKMSRKGKKSFDERYKVNLTHDKEEAEVLKKIVDFDRKLQTKTFKNVRKHDDLIVHIRENQYGDRRVVQAQFKTLGCNRKRAGSCWNCNYGVVDKCLITPNQYKKAFQKELKRIAGNVLVLESLGSITDPSEFNPKVFSDILKMAIEDGKFDTILIETHLTQIAEDLVKEISTMNNGQKHIGFEIGMEDMNPENRKLIHKIGIQNEQLTELYATLQKYGMGLGINLIYGFPFMSEQERIDAVVNSVKTISRNLSEAEIILFLMSVKENTIMKHMQASGMYQPANPWGLVEVTKQILSNDDIKNLITFSWFGEKEDPYIKEETCYSCEDCKNLIVSFFRKMNGTFDWQERKHLLTNLLEQAEDLTCECYEDFQRQLKENDGKNPRYEISRVFRKGESDRRWRKSGIKNYREFNRDKNQENRIRLLGSIHFIKNVVVCI